MMLPWFHIHNIMSATSSLLHSIVLPVLKRLSIKLIKSKKSKLLTAVSALPKASPVCCEFAVGADTMSADGVEPPPLTGGEEVGGPGGAFPPPGPRNVDIGGKPDADNIS